MESKWQWNRLLIPDMMLTAYHGPGTVLDAKITEVTKTGEVPVPMGTISWGTQKNTLQDLIHCGRTIP